MKLIAGASVLIGTLILNGCTYNKGIVISSADRGPNDKVVGIVS